MEEAGDPHFKRERSAYGQPPPLHMPPADAAHLHNYHHPAPQGGPMSQPWNPAPSPYHDGSDHRPPPLDGPHHQPPPSFTPQPSYHPLPPPSQTSSYPPDASYSRQNSTSGSTRSPPIAQPSHYPPPINSGPPPENYYSRPDYGNRPPYPPPESPANAPHQPALHIQTTSHEMMSSQAPAQGPPPGYPPPSHSAGPPPTPHYWAPPPGDWYQQQRRKPVRAAQACDSCRQRKAKCDEGRPDCTHCKENGLRCTYRDVPPQKSEKQMLQMSEKVDALGDKSDSLGEKLDEHIKATDQKLETLLNIVQSWTSRPLDPSWSGSATMTRTESRQPHREEPQSEGSVRVNSHRTINSAFIDGTSNTIDHVTVVGGIPNPGAKTSASDLLLWPAIKELVPIDIDVSYVIDGESQRGLLRLYGCGEGEDRNDGHDGPPSPAASSSSGRMVDDEAASNSSPSGVWGTGHFPQREGTHYPVYEHVGGVTPHGELLLDRKAVDMYVKSYLERMHILHPFLDQKVLRKMVHAFKQKHSWDYSNINRLTQSVGAGAKRKRDMSESPGSTTDEVPMHSIPHHNGIRYPGRSTIPIEHSVSNAIILLVIALGKICAYDKPLPGPPKSSSVTSNAKTLPPQPLLGYGDLPPYVPPSSAPASPYNAPYVNGGSLPLATATLQGKNMDVIPGLAYFAKAADILGELPGGVDVSHIQANLLAGLYMGQLARVIPSHWYIANACRACQILIRSPDYKNDRMPKKRRNLINLAFWSCLQLESDILAELDVPASGIVRKEASMLMEIPNALTIGDDEEVDQSSDGPEQVLRHYSNQIQLRRTINDAVHNIYNAEREQNRPPRLIETISENLESWREILKEWSWDDVDHMSPHINHARMRGKYYGAKYIINRPALQYALTVAHQGPGTPISHLSQSPHGIGMPVNNVSPAITSHGISAPSRRVSEMRPPTRPAESPEQLEEWILAACERCVKAAILSTTAFDAVGGRLVITNILGTAHAQFGNVLVLAATFNSPNPTLRALVPEQKLRELLTRTIGFLDKRAGISPALATDAEILRHVQSKLFPSSSAMKHISSANSSFTSNR